MGIHVLKDSLRHSPHNHVVTEAVHHLAVQGTQGTFLLIAITDERHRLLFAHSPKELLKIHRIHIDAMFLRGNHYVFYILVYADERPRLYIIVTTILHQILNGSTGLRIKLHLIEHYHGITRMQRHVEIQGYIAEEQVQVLQIHVKDFHQVIICIVEVHQDVAFVLLLCKLLHDVALAYSTGTVYHQGGLALCILLPQQHFIVYFPSHICMLITFSRGFKVAFITFSRDFQYLFLTF